MSTDNETLIKALRILARDIVSDDGVANACVDEAAARIEELVKENEQLKLAKAELVEALRLVDDLVSVSVDLSLDGLSFSERKTLRSREAEINAKINAALAKHGGGQ